MSDVIAEVSAEAFMAIGPKLDLILSRLDELSTQQAKMNLKKRSKKEVAKSADSGEATENEDEEGAAEPKPKKAKTHTVQGMWMAYRNILKGLLRSQGKLLEDKEQAKLQVAACFAEFKPWVKAKIQKEDGTFNLLTSLEKTAQVKEFLGSMGADKGVQTDEVEHHADDEADGQQDGMEGEEEQEGEKERDGEEGGA